MKFFRKLFWIDMVLLVSVLSLLFIKSGTLRDVIIGMSAALFVISISNHVRYYMTNKKFY